MGGTQLTAGAIIAAEDNGTAKLATGHVEHLRGVVQNGVGGHETERPAHEFTNWTQTTHGGANRHSGEPGFRNWRVNDALGTKLIQHATGDFVRPVVLRDLFTEEEDTLVTPHLFTHGFIQSITKFNLTTHRAPPL